MGKAIGTMIGKHDQEHKTIMDSLLRENSLDTYSSFERLRGRVCLVGPSLERELASKLFIAQYPDFVFAKDEFPQGDIHFQYFRQLI